MRKLNTTILIGLLVAGLGFVLVFAYGSNVDDRVADGKATVEVLVATQPLAAGSTVSDLDGKVETRKVPKAFLTSDAVRTLDDVKGLVLLGPIPQEGQLSKASFGQARGAVAVQPSKGNIALAIGVDLTPGVARYITAGSTVDVFATYTSGSQTSSANQGDQKDIAVKRTKLFVSNIKVMSVSVAEVPDDNAGNDADQTTSQRQESIVEVVAVLDVSPAQAEQIVNAQTLGQIYLGLNSIDGTDGQNHKTPTGVTPEQVVTANK